MSSRTWLFVLSCIALVTSAFTFSIRGNILLEMGNHFHFSQEQNGAIDGARFWGMAASLLLGGFICDWLGMKRIMWLAFLSHVGGTLGMVFAPTFGGDVPKSLLWIQSFSFILGCGNGFTETAINPLVATLYPKEKTHYLNVLHAWWPGGLIIGGFLAMYVGQGIDLPLQSFGIDYRVLVAGQGFNWWQSLLMIIAPAIIYGFMLLTAKFPETERVASGVSTGRMFMESFRPGFILWGICMLLTASTELGPQSWQSSVMEKTAGLNGTQILIYTAGMMFILRHFAGPIAHQISPIGLLVVSSILSGVGLYLLSFANNAATAFTYATIFGLGVTYFWPTMLGVASERFPKGGAMILCLLGTIGNAAIALTIPQMGQIVDHYSVQTVEASETNKELASLILKTNSDGKPIALNTTVIEELKGMKTGEQDPATPIVPADSPIAKLSKDEVNSLLGVVDKAQSVGFSMAFRWVSLLPAALVIIFGLIWIYDFSRGGYKAEQLLSKEEENDLFEGGSQGPTS
jgi:fucose permease